MQYINKFFIHYYKVNNNTLVKVLQQNTKILAKLEMVISGQKELKDQMDWILKMNKNNNNDNNIHLNQEFIKVFVTKLIKLTNFIA